jgi:uncharacterized protein
VITAVVGVLTASLLGSVHCAAMCGGFVCFYGGDATGAQALRGHTMYNAGRFTSYIMLGAVAGLVGSGVTQLGAVAGVGRAAALLAGVLMVAWGAGTLLALGGVRTGAARAPEGWQRMLGRTLYSVRNKPIAVRAGLTGLLTTLLPCGWLYVFVATAAGTGSMLRGMLVMSVFWLGSLPALLAVGLGAQRVFGPLRQRLPAAGAAIVMIMGLFALSGRLQFGELRGGAEHVAQHQHHGGLRP